MIRSAVRTVDALSRIPDALGSRSFAGLLGRCSAEFGAVLETVRAERAGNMSAAGSVGVSQGGAGGM